jgi:hypothetical protein
MGLRFAGARMNGKRWTTSPMFSTSAKGPHGTISLRSTAGSWRLTMSNSPIGTTVVDSEGKAVGTLKHLVLHLWLVREGFDTADLREAEALLEELR